MIDDHYARHLFTFEGRAVGRAFVNITGKNGNYESRLDVVPEHGFYRHHNRYGKRGDPSPQDAVNQTMAERYPDLVNLKNFLDKNPGINPEGLDFKNACARAALEPPPMFDKRQKIYLRQERYGPAPTEDEFLKDKFLVANSGNAPDKSQGFIRDFPQTKIDNSKIFTFGS